MSLGLLVMLIALIAVTNWLSREIGYAKGRADAFAEAQRWHLEDDEAVKQALRNRE